MYDSHVAHENLSPIEELKRLEQRLEQIHTLGELQPLFARAEEIAQKHSADFDVQLAEHELKQKILALGTKLRQGGAALPPRAVSTPPPPPASARSEEATVVMSPASKPFPTPEPLKKDSIKKDPIKPSIGPPVNNEPPDEIAEDAPKESRGRVVALWVFASIVALAGAGIAISVIQDRTDRAAATTLVDVRISTTPPGASILVNDQPTCISDCVAKLLPGTYRVSAVFDGYDPAAAELTVGTQETASLDLKLLAQSPRVRVLAELREGKVFLDEKLAGDLQDGSFTIEQVTPGTHSLRIMGGGSEAKIQFTAKPGALPTVDGPIETKDLLAAVVSNSGGQARMVTSTGPLKLSVNGVEQAPATTDGVELPGYRAGTDQFVLTQGTKDHTLSETFGQGSALTVFLQTDQNIGTLVIATGQDGVRVFLNDKESTRRTQRGELRLQTIGRVNVRVAKEGFEEVAPQVATVEKGAETKLTFAMKALPPFSSLIITGATPGAEVVVDQRVIGSIAPDGTFRNSSITPGERGIELRRDQFEPKHLMKTFRAGQTVTISGSDAALLARNIPAPPPPQPQAVAPKTPAEVAKAPSPSPPRAASGDISNFDVPSAWKEESGIWRHRGAATLTYGLRPNGVFTFSIYLFRGGNLFRGGRVRWFLNYIDAANYSLFELDEDNFWAKTVTKGKTVDRKKVAHKQNKNNRVWNIQVNVSPARMIHKIQGDNDWIDLDNWSDPSRDFTTGKFGFLINGKDDEIGLSNFHFTGH